LSVGGSVKLDKETGLTALVNGKGDILANLTHQLTTNAKFSLVSSFNLNSKSAKSFGFALTLGETSE
jgi:hypothetical protein